MNQLRTPSNLLSYDTFYQTFLMFSTVRLLVFIVCHVCVLWKSSVISWSKCYVTTKVLYCELSNLAFTPSRQHGPHFTMTDEAWMALWDSRDASVLSLLVDAKRRDTSIPAGTIQTQRAQNKRETSSLNSDIITKWHKCDPAFSLFPQNSPYYLRDQILLTLYVTLIQWSIVVIPICSDCIRSYNAIQKMLG